MWTLRDVIKICSTNLKLATAALDPVPRVELHLGTEFSYLPTTFVQARHCQGWFTWIYVVLSIVDKSANFKEDVFGIHFCPSKNSGMKRHYVVLDYVYKYIYIYIRITCWLIETGLNSWWCMLLAMCSLTRHGSGTSWYIFKVREASKMAWTYVGNIN